MATIMSANLTITVSSNKVTPVMRYKVFFSQGDLNLMKQFPGLYRVRCELWGADSGLTGGDDKIFVYPTIKVYPDGSPSALEEGNFTAVLNKGAELDEDFGGDEVYGKVILHNTFANTKVAKNSNEVSGSF